VERKCQPARGTELEADVRARRALELKAKALQALGHPARLLILEALRHGERCVCELTPVLGLRQPNISQHLSILRSANLVVARRDGTRAVYRVVDSAVFEIIDRMGEVVRRQGEEMASALGELALPEEQ